MIRAFVDDIATCKSADLAWRHRASSDREVVNMMIGREYHNTFPVKPEGATWTLPPVLECRSRGETPRLRDISLTVGVGEVGGPCGLGGQGQRELLLALFGIPRGAIG